MKNERELWIMHTDDEMPLKMNLYPKDEVFQPQLRGDMLRLGRASEIQDIENLIKPMMKNLATGKTTIGKIPYLQDYLTHMPCPETGKLKKIVGIFYNKENEGDWTTPLNTAYAGIATNQNQGVIPTDKIPRGRIVMVTDSYANDSNANVSEWQPHFRKCKQWAEEMHVMCKGTFPYLLEKGINVEGMLPVYGKTIAGIALTTADIDEMAGKLSTEDMMIAMTRLRDLLTMGLDLEEEEE